MTKQLGILKEQIAVNRDLEEIVGIRYEGGSATALDLLQQEQQLASLEAQLPLTEAALLTQRQRMASFQARDPVKDLPEAVTELPPLPPIALAPNPPILALGSRSRHHDPCPHRAGSRHCQ